MSTYKPNKVKTTNIELSITLKNKTLIHHIVKKQVDWINERIVELSSFKYASPMVVARKKDGSPRLCIDYRKLNKIVSKDKYPLPVIEDQIDQLAEARIFSTIDFKNGFFHVHMAEQSRNYTALLLIVANINS